jgi:hypothetical protein
MWTDKTYRLILNTKLFDKMQVDKANKKSVRLTGFDSGTIRMFLVKTANINDCDELYETLCNRLEVFNQTLSHTLASTHISGEEKSKTLYTTPRTLVLNVKKKLNSYFI